MFLNKPRILKEFGIHPTNFALARAMAGDKSDNLPGVKGVGLATISKRLPFFADDDSVTIDKLMEFCKNDNTGLKAFSNICESRDAIESNYKIMQLYSPLISPQGKRKIKYNIDNADYRFNKTEIMKMMMEDGFGTYNWDSLFQNFKRISLENKS